LWLGDKKI